jgi:hypothetical protein
MLSTVSERPPKAKYQVLKSLRMNIIELDHISEMARFAVPKMWLRVQRLREEIDVLKMASRARQRRMHEAWLERLG